MDVLETCCAVGRIAFSRPHFLNKRVLQYILYMVERKYLLSRTCSTPSHRDLHSRRRLGRPGSGGQAPHHSHAYPPHAPLPQETSPQATSPQASSPQAPPLTSSHICQQIAPQIALQVAPQMARHACCCVSNSGSFCFAAAGSPPAPLPWAFATSQEHKMSRFAGAAGTPAPSTRISWRRDVRCSQPIYSPAHGFVRLVGTVGRECGGGGGRGGGGCLRINRAHEKSWLRQTALVPCFRGIGVLKSALLL